MIERSSENTEIAKLQSDDADFAALTALIRKACDMSDLGQKLIAMADQITESAGVLAERTGHLIEDVCLSMAPGRA
jgi:hypothetical protein